MVYSALSPLLAIPLGREALVACVEEVSLLHVHVYVAWNL